MYFYVTNNQCIIGDNGIPKGTIGYKFYESDLKVKIYDNRNRSNYFSGLITDLKKENDSSYADKADLEAVLPDFFFNIMASFYTKVGIGGSYDTIQLALADGKYNLEVITNITETVNWGSHIKDIVLIADQERIVNLSISNNGAYNIYAKNINFSITGINDIFGNDNYFYFENCAITGDSASNIFNYKDSIVDATELTINTGDDGVRIQSLRNIGKLTINGNCSGGSNLEASRGVIDYLLTTGSFGADYLNDYILTGTEMTIRFIRKDHTGDAGFNISSYSHIAKSNTSINLKIGSHSSVINVLINKLSIEYNGATIENCYINEIEAGIINKTLKSFENNIIYDDITISQKNNINNCKFQSLIIDANACNINNCECNVGTVTINAAKDKTTVIGNRTVTNIVNNGTNTQGSTGTLGNQLI